MAKNDVKIVKTGGGYEATFLTATSASLVPGDLVKKNGDYVTRIADGDPEVATDMVVGVVTEASTDTASVAGTVKVLIVAPDTVLRFNANNSTNVNTQAKIDALKMHSVSCDLSGTTITLDEDETDDPDVHGFVIVGGDPKKYTLDAMINEGVGFQGSAT